MNYHLMIDDKFIDGFIEEVEQVSSAGLNTYIIRGEKENAVHVRHSKAIWAVPQSTAFNEIIKSITPNDKLVVHWLDEDLYSYILNLQKDIPLYVTHWGGEFYNAPHDIHKKWLYDAHTKKYIASIENNPDVTVRNPLALAKRIWNDFQSKKSGLAQYALKKRVVQRINFILLHEANGDEVTLTAKLYDAPQLEHLPFFYDVNIEMALNLQDTCISADNKKCRILLGNSATETNNHLDAFEVLKRFRNDDIEIEIPLSYGSENYQQLIAKRGKHIFGNKVELLTGFMLREEYIKQLSAIDIGIMFHNRSQAFGNCIALLGMGKKLFIKKNNPLWTLFTKTGIKVYDANTINKLSFEELKQPLPAEQKAQHRQVLQTAFSRAKRLQWYKQIFG